MLPPTPRRHARVGSELVRELALEVSDARVLDAMRRVPRHLFVPGASLAVAYANSPAPIGHGQTISQPVIVAIMTEALELTGRERVLEIGTGSGYQAAVLALLAAEVHSVENIPALADEARSRLRAPRLLERARPRGRRLRGLSRRRLPSTASS